MATSFKKKATSRPQHPRGSRPSIHSTQLLVSTGVPSLDALLGGGLCMGSILLVEEDTHDIYSRLLLKYFLAEGVMCGHSILLSSANCSPESIVTELPGPLDDGKDSGALPSLAEEEAADDEAMMKIAWRYQSKAKIQSSFSNRYGHFFDLTQTLPKEKVDAVSRTLVDMTSNFSKASDLYEELTTSISTALHNNKQLFLHDKNAQMNVLRIALHSLGSPLWMDNSHEDGSSTDLPRFLHSLRGMLRQECAVAVLTVPTHLLQDAAFVRRIEKLCDSVIRLESFAGSVKEQNPVYKEYHGLFHLLQLPRINTLTSHYPETLDLAFKLKRKRFLIERLHLPPELSEIASRSQEDPVNTTGGKRVNSKSGSIKQSIGYQI